MSVTIINNIPEFKSKFNSNKSLMFNELGNFIKSKMDTYVAVKTGNLRNHNYTDSSSEGLRFGNDCSYASPQEFGTYKMAAHPFVRPSIYNHVNELASIAARGLSNGIG
jgi:hypothetical protein